MAVHGKEFLDWLRTGGIIPENTRRVVIDASVNSATMIYVETFASRKMIEVDVPDEFRGARVQVVE